MRWSTGRVLEWVLAPLVFCLALAPPARADNVAHSVRQLRSSGDYKIRLSAALLLAKQDGDARAVVALAQALADDRESTVRRVAALSLGRLVDGHTSPPALRAATRALQHAARADHNRRVRRTAQISLGRVRRAVRSQVADAREAAPARANGIFVQVGKASDLSRRLPSGGTQALVAAVRGSLRRHAPDYVQAGAAPTRAELESRRLRGFYVGAQVAKVHVSRAGGHAEVRCTVSVRVSPWSGRDGNERLAARQSASATGSGEVSASPSQAGRAALDCALAVADELTARQVVPFLRRLSRTR